MRKVSGVLDPFRPTAGATPPVLVGRDEVLKDISYAFDAGVGTAEWFTLFVGPRGVGKTTVLNAVEDLAQQRSWHVFPETATKGFVARLARSVFRRCEQLSSGNSAQITAVKAGPATISFTPVEKPHVEDLRTELSKLTDMQLERDEKLHQTRTGVLITLDELHRNTREELVEFATTIQHMIRENRPVAVAMAGIPTAVSPLLADAGGDNPITFLRRADRHDLGAISAAEVRRGLQEPVENAGLKWAPSALQNATAACGGYAFMIQLVGSWAFRYRDGDVISEDAAHRGILQARRRLGALVHQTALNDLSDLDRTFLVAMAQDKGESAIGEVAERLNISPQQANNYRLRLLEAGMIVQTGYGKIGFALPFLREYLRDHVAAKGMESFL
ncbi:MAG: ATP-binding protein [Actinomycetaceae bacterium]|nr:ATP-binding protein [Actinomycetaceae bacterium]